MHSRTHKWFLVMIALALAIAPLRGAWAMSMPTNVDSTSHCVQMDMQAADTLASMQQDGATDPKCEQDCTKTCCDGACNTCTQGAPGISDSVNITTVSHDTQRNFMLLAYFPERTVTPPLRPPASL